MFNVLFWMALGCAILDWLASWREWKRTRWLTKPGTLVLLIAWFSSIGQWRGTLALFGAGLVFSLLGDILLLLPARYFLPGVGAFFATHVLYIIGFSSQPLSVRWTVVLPVLVVAGAFTLLNDRIRAGLQKQQLNQLILPVMAYAAVLSLMLLMALSTLMRPAWGMQPAIIVSVGASLFFFSDSVLAYDRFVRPLPNSNLMVMTSYHLAQICIAAGTLLQFAK